MSLVNDMLRDLEKRKASPATGSPEAGASRESMIEPKQSSFKTKDIFLLALVFLVAILAAYIWLSREELRLPQEVSLEALPEAPQVQSVSTQKLQEPQPEELAQTILSNQAVENTRNRQVIEAELKRVEQKVSPVAKARVATAAPMKAVEAKSLAKPVPQKEETRLLTKNSKDLAASQNKVSRKHVSTEITTPKPEQRIKPEQTIKPTSQVLGVVLSPSALDLKTASDAISLFQVGKPAAAYSLMQTFVAENKVVDKTLGVLANRLLQDQRFSELSALLERAGKPLSPGLRQVKARWLLMQGEPELAVALLEPSLPDIETLPEYYALMASLYQRNGQAGKAFEHYSQLIQSNDTVADWWAGLGVAADQLGQGRQAMFAYQQAMSLPGLNRALEQYIGQRLSALSEVE